MKHGSIRFCAVVLAVSLLFSLLPTGAAAEPIVYDAAELPVFQRTRQEVADKYNAARRPETTYVDGNRATYYVRPASTSAPYDQGVVTQDLLDAMTGMANFIRWLSGAKPLLKTPTNNDSLQRQALIRNFHFSHYVDDAYKPDDMDQAFWDAGAVMSHNILAMGYTPVGAISGWCNEGYSLYNQSWGTVGHRNAILSHGVSFLELGFAGAVAIGKNTEYQNTVDSPFTAYPAPGPVPQKLVAAKEAAWSVYLNTAVLKNPDTNRLCVTITDQNGNVLTRTKADGSLQATTASITFVQPDCGERLYPEDATYEVAITGLTDVKTSQPAELRYKVEFFDSVIYEKTTVQSATATDCTKLKLPSSLATQEQLTLLTALLPDTVSVTTANGRTCQVPCITDWALDETNKRWFCQADASALPETVTDPNGLLNEVSVPYEISYVGTMYLNGSAVLGQPGTLVISPYWLTTEDVIAYQIAETDGQNALRRRFDQDDPNFSKVMNASGSSWHYEFAIAAWAFADSGTWFTVLHSPSGTLSLTNTVAVEVTCPHSETETYTEPPTCLEPGVTKTVCKLCLVVLSEESLPALGHSWSKWQVERQPTCTDEGLEYRLCQRCTARDERGIDALGHDFGEPTRENETAPTCTEPGGYDLVVRCTRCGEMYSFEAVVIVPLGHSWDDGVVIKEPTEEETGEKRYTCTVCGATTTETLPVLPPFRFEDVANPEQYFFEPVYWAYNHKPQITSGVDATHFGPKKTCTRAQVMTFLWSAFGRPEPEDGENPFEDVKQSDYYYKAVLWACQNGITGGVDSTHFQPKGPCTRAQVVTFLWSAKNKPEPTASETGFVDVSPEKYYYKAVLWAAEVGVTGGTDPTHFSPKMTCTRAQVVTFLYGLFGKQTED